MRAMLLALVATMASATAIMPMFSTSMPSPVCRRLRSGAVPSRHTFAAPRHVTFNDRPCEANEELGVSFRPIPVTRVHDKFVYNGVFMYYARGCSTTHWNPGRTLAGPHKLDIALTLLMQSKAGCDLACAKELFLQGIAELEGGTAEGMCGTSGLCKIPAFCRIVREYEPGAPTSRCPTRALPWSRIAVAIDCEVDTLIGQHARAQGYDSVQILHSPQGTNLSSWRTELWDLRDFRQHTDVISDVANGRPTGQEFLAQLSCRKGAVGDSSKPCQPTATFSECMACEGCNVACEPFQHRFRVPTAPRADTSAAEAELPELCRDAVGPLSSPPPRAGGISSIDKVDLGRRLIINLGLIKTGTTSFHTALAMMGVETCKWVPSPLTMRMADVADFVRAPTRGSSQVHDVLLRSKCEALSDNPWWALYPALMKHFPGAQFVLTTRGTDADCRKWLRSAAGTWKGHDRGRSFTPGYKDFHRCVFGNNTLSPATEEGFLQRCRTHAASVIAHAKAYKIPLLVIPVEWNSTAKWTAVGEFLNIDVARLKNEKWPHA